MNLETRGRSICSSGLLKRSQPKPLSASQADSPQVIYSVPPSLYNLFFLPGHKSDVVVHAELQRVRSEPQRLNLSLAFVADPALD